MASILSRACIKRARRDTTAFCKSAGFSIPTVASFLLGSTAFYYLKGVEAMVGEAETWVAYTLGPIGALAVLTFLYNLVCAPFRLERDRCLALSKELDELRTKVAGLEGNPRERALQTIKLLQDTGIECDFRVVPHPDREIGEIEHNKVWYVFKLDRALQFILEAIVGDWDKKGRHEVIRKIKREIEG